MAHLESFTFDGFPQNLEPIAKQIEDRMRADANYRELVHRWLADVGIAASHDPAEDAKLFAYVMSKRPQDDPEKVMNALGELVGVIALTGIGVAGIFDPSPVLDGAGTVVALGMMRYSGWYFVDAALSGVSMVPYLGDAVGKPVLLARMASRIDDILRVINRFSSGMGQHVRTAIEAMKAGREIPRLPRGAVALMARVASTGSRSLDDVLGALRAMPDVPYARMDAFKAYMKRRGVSVYDGAQGAGALDKMGYPNAEGMFLAFRTDDGRVLTGFIFRGQPNRAVVHHELWHQQDFVRNYARNFDNFRDARTIDKERYVHQRLTGTGPAGSSRGQTRWQGYTPKEQANQSLYIDRLEQEHKLESIMGQLESMGIKLGGAD